MTDRLLLKQGVLECIRGLRRHPLLVEHLGLYQLHQAAPQRQLIQGRHGLEQLIRKRPPQDRPSCATALPS